MFCHVHVASPTVTAMPALRVCESNPSSFVLSSRRGRPTLFWHPPPSEISAPKSLIDHGTPRAFSKPVHSNTSFGIRYRSVKRKEIAPVRRYGIYQTRQRIKLEVRETVVTRDGEVVRPRRLGSAKQRWLSRFVNCWCQRFTYSGSKPLEPFQAWMCHVLPGG